MVLQFPSLRPEKETLQQTDIYISINYQKVHFKVSELMEVSQERFLPDLCSPTSEVSLETKGRNKNSLIQREFLVVSGSALSIQKIILHAVLILEI